MFRRAGREVHSVATARTTTHEFLRDRLVITAIVSVVVALVSAALALMFERHAKGTEISNYGDALFWASAQLLTVSSSLRNPLTTGGRVLDVAMEAYALIVVTTLAGSFGAFFHQRGKERRAEMQRASSG